MGGLKEGGREICGLGNINNNEISLSTIYNN